PRLITRSGRTSSFMRWTKSTVSRAAWWLILRSLPSKRASGPKCRSVTKPSVSAIARILAAGELPRERARSPVVDQPRPVGSELPPLGAQADPRQLGVRVAGRRIEVERRRRPAQRDVLAASDGVERRVDAARPHVQRGPRRRQERERARQRLAGDRSI